MNCLTTIWFYCSFAAKSLILNESSTEIGYFFVYNFYSIFWLIYDYDSLSFTFVEIISAHCFLTDFNYCLSKCSCRISWCLVIIELNDSPVLAKYKDLVYWLDICDNSFIESKFSTLHGLHKGSDVSLKNLESSFNFCWQTNRCSYVDIKEDCILDDCIWEFWNLFY